MTAPEDDDQRDRLVHELFIERFGTAGPAGELTWPRVAPPRRHRRRSNTVAIPEPEQEPS